MWQNILHHFVMEPRRDWNAMGPCLPPWFRRRLKRIDRRLVCQFIPPKTVDKSGIDPMQYPLGVWTICRKLPGGSGWLYKRWTWDLSNQFGNYEPPGMDTIEMIRLARDLHRANQCEALEEEFGRAVDSMKADRERASMEQAAEHLRGILNRLHIRGGSGHVFMRGSRIAAA